MSRPLVLPNNFRSFADLTTAYDEGAGNLVIRVPRPSSIVGIVAPHGVRIEEHTSEIATAIESADFSFYFLQAIRSTGNYAALHLTSHYFDEPGCLELLATSNDADAIHGCQVVGGDVLVGGLDNELVAELCGAMTKADLECHLDGHELPETYPKNICNRGRRRVGVQLVLSAALSQPSPCKRKFGAAVPEVWRRAARRHKRRAAKPSA